MAFLTNLQKLETKIGAKFIDRLKAGVAAKSAKIHDVGSWRDVEAMDPAWRQGVGGVVIVGGHDVLPSQALRTIPDELLQPVKAIANANSPDPDHFVVWNDDVYAGEGNILPDLPVSRVPDCGSDEALERALLGSPPALAKRRFGLRNHGRPFGSDVYLSIPGTETMLASEPMAHGDYDAELAAASAAYFILHGDAGDGRALHGETSSGVPIRAFCLSNALISSDKCPDVVLLGACWGALCTDRPAVQARAGVSPRPSKDSIALTYVASGARAVIGPTGAQYSSSNSVSRLSGALHHAFWQEFGASGRPAEALLTAKKHRYAAGVADLEMFRKNHAPDSALFAAYEIKNARQFTCLGLGW